MPKKIFFLFITLFYYNISLAQNQIVIDSLLKVLKSNISKNKKVDTYVRIAKAYNYADSVNKANYANKAIQLARKINYSKGKIDALLQLGVLNEQVGYFSEAKQKFKQIIKEAKSSNYLQAQAESLDELGKMMYNQGKIKQALNYYSQSINIKKN